MVSRYLLDRDYETRSAIEKRRKLIPVLYKDSNILRTEKQQKAFSYLPTFHILQKNSWNYNSFSSRYNYLPWDLLVYGLLFWCLAHFWKKVGVVARMV